MIRTLCLLPLLLLTLLTAHAQSSKPINIAVAANLLFPMQKIEELYEAKYNDNIHLISASSGVLTAQINNGAPYHLFFSADMKYPQLLAENGKTLTQPQVLVKGRLVSWSKQKFTEAQLIQFLKSEQIKTIAIAQPSLAPYGQAAKNWLEKEGIFKGIENKLVYGENVGQVNRYIYSGAVEVAFTAVSAMFSEELKDKGYWLLLANEKEDDALLAHGWVILISASNKMDKVKQFIEFLSTPAAKEVFRDFGYITP
jgi:molybdate transport system substrate-binding protein